jgi:hypothetical protein
MRAALAALAVLALAGRAQAHDAWADGTEVPAWVKSACCGPADAHILEPGDYSIDKDGFHVRGVDMVVPLDRVSPSQDGRVWAFYRKEMGSFATIYCVFYSGSI